MRAIQRRGGCGTHDAPTRHTSTQRKFLHGKPADSPPPLFPMKHAIIIIIIIIIIVIIITRHRPVEDGGPVVEVGDGEGGVGGPKGFLQAVPGPLAQRLPPARHRRKVWLAEINKAAICCSCAWKDCVRDQSRAE